MPWSDSENLLAGLGGGSQHLQEPRGHLNFDYEEGEEGVWESGWSSHGPVGTPLSDPQDMCFPSPLPEDILSWIWPEVRTESHGSHEGDGVVPTTAAAGTSAVEAGTKDVGEGTADVEDGWWLSFPISAFLAHESRTSRPPWNSSLESSSNEPYRESDDSSGAPGLLVRPHPVASYTVSDVQTENTSSFSQDDEVPASKGGEEMKSTLSPPHQ